MDYTKELRTVAFCAGYAGIEKGLELAGQPCRVIAYSEIEAYACANLVAKMEAGELGAAPIWTDLKTFPMEQFSGKVDLLTGGFPCQPFSSAGLRKGDSDPRHLFPYFKRFAEIVRPRYLFLENVDGIASAKLSATINGDETGTPVLLHVLRELERVGYRVAAGCFTASEMGAPHKRARWFIYAELADTNSINRGPEQKREREKRSEELHRMDELGDTAGLQCDGGRPEQTRQFKSEKPKSGNQNSELDDPVRQGLQRHSGNEYREGRQSAGQTGSITAPSISLQWPAPPGPYQYGWEEPRTVSHTTDIGFGRRKNNTNRTHSGRIQESEEEIGAVVRCETPGCGGDGKASNDKTKPQLGGATDGLASRVDAVANRVDRLRLCGNGVVPQTAARAWITLRWLLENHEPTDWPIITDFNEENQK